MFGLKIALIYVVTGEIIAIVSGIIIGKLKMEKYVEGYVYEMKMGEDLEMPDPTIKERLKDSWVFTKDLIKKIWIYVIIGVGIGAFIHGIIPLVSELTRAGVAMGTALAFMMAVTGLSFPKAILLRRV